MHPTHFCLGTHNRSVGAGARLPREGGGPDEGNTGERSVQRAAHTVRIKNIARRGGEGVWVGASAPVRLRTKRCSRIDWTRRGSNGEGKHLDNVNSRAFVVATEQSGRTQAAVWLSQATTSATNHEHAFEIWMTHRISVLSFSSTYVRRTVKVCL